MNWKVTKLPKILSYWLVDNFDTEKCAIQFADGEEIKIDEEDVHLTLGIPRGDALIEMPRIVGKSKLKTEWRKQFKDVPAHKMPQTNDVCKKMLEYKNAGKWFKRNFVVALTSLVIESM